MRALSQELPHDLGNLLHRIRTSSYILETYGGKLTLKERKAHFANINEATSAIHDLLKARDSLG